MKTFLEITTDDLIQRYSLAGLEQLTLVFPMQRAGLFVKQYLSSIMQISPSPAPLVLPRFTTIDALADSLCDLQPDDEITSVCALYQIYHDHTTHHLPIDAFYGWGVQLLNDFSSADMALVDGDHLMHYTSVEQLYEHDDLNEDTRQRLQQLIQSTGPIHSVQEYFTELWAQLPAIYTDFQQQCLQLGVGTRGARTRWVIEHFDLPAIQQRIAGRTFVFIGFNYLLPAEARLMDLFKDREQALFYWDHDPDFTLDDTVYGFIRQNMDHFGNSLSPFTFRHSPNITALACQSSSAQAQYVHEWLLTHHHPGERSAVVIADESLLQSVIYSLPNTDELNARINITKGYPLRSTHLFAQTITLLNQSVDAATPINELLPAVIHSLHDYYQQTLLPEEDSWQRVLLDESYYQIQVVLRQIQLLILQNDFVRNQLQSGRVLANLVRRKLESVTIPFHGEPITDVQIIGVLETRLLDFDHVLILNVEEDIVPSRSNDRSFLPYDLRREYGMATREEESRIYAYNFFRLMRRASDVTLTFSDSFTDRGKRTMSRFLMQMLCSPDYTIQRLRLTESTTIVPYTLDSTTFSSLDTFPTHLSPSSISAYIECPRQFYLRYIRQLSDSSIDQLMLPPNAIGSLFHAIMHHAYMEICAGHIRDGQLLHPVLIQPQVLQSYLNDPKALSRALDLSYAEVNDSFLKFHPQSEIATPYIRANHEAENHALLQLAKRTLQRDLQQAPFTLVWLEHRIRTTIQGITIQGVIDRMDIVSKDNQTYLRILDYKTSGFSEDKLLFKPQDLFSDPEKKYALQTLIYCEMVRHNLPEGIDPHLPIRPELIFVKQISQAGNLTCKFESETLPIMDYVQDYAQPLRSGLEQLATTISIQCQPGQEFPMQPDEDICAKSFCPFHLLCGRKSQ